MATIAERIQEALEIRNLKQTDLVEKTGIGKSSISTYISGEYEPKQRNIYKIAEALDVNEAWLMGHDVPMDRDIKPVKKIKVNINKRNLSEAIKTVLENSKKNSGEINWEKVIHSNKIFIDNVNQALRDITYQDLENIEENDLEIIEDMNEILLLKNYRKLNDIGQREAIKRVEELTYIDKYKKSLPNVKWSDKEETPDYLMLNAAHEIEGATEEDKKHDDDIMDDDNF